MPVVEPGRPVAAVDDADVLVLGLLAANASRHEVAARLGCSTATVDRRLSRLREHYGVATTIEAVVRAVREGLV